MHEGNARMKRKEIDRDTDRQRKRIGTLVCRKMFLKLFLAE